MQDAPDLFVDLDSIDPQVIFAKGGAEVALSEIEASVWEAAASPDISTATARGAIAAVAYKVARTKTALDERGKAHVAYLKEQAKEVDGERKAIRDRLDALRDAVRKPLTDWETAENERIEEHQRALAEIEGAAVFDLPEPEPDAIRDRIERLSRLGGNRDWQEFQKRADAAREAAMAKLTAMLGVAVRRMSERAELERLREHAAEAARQAEIARAAEATIARVRLEAAGAVAEANQRAEDAAALARQQIESAQAQERSVAEARADNKEHRAAINSAVRDAICVRGISINDATALVVAIARGQIEHLSINY